MRNRIVNTHELRVGRYYRFVNSQYIFKVIYFDDHGFSIKHVNNGITYLGTFDINLDFYDIGIYFKFGK